MKTITYLSTITALIVIAVLLGAADITAQEKQKISYKQPAETSKYTQQHIIDVGDVPGHQIRIFELHRTFPTNPPVFEGVKVVESWARSWSDYIGYSGRNQGYTIFVLENGDKIFAKSDGVFQTSPSADGSRKGVGSSVLTLTGGTGKFRAIGGILRVSSNADPKAGFNESQVEGEYWIDK